MEELYSI